MHSININLGEKSYPIYIASEGWKILPQAINGRVKGTKILVISDGNTYHHYYHLVENILISMGFKVYSAVITPGESSKNFRCAQMLYSKALEANLGRESTIIALGGGVVGDLAGFVAATYMRGIGFIQLPTSLLAQVDSSIGGKVAINHPLAKNIIGAFYQPSMVFINPNTLTTLPPRELATGMAELIKHGFIADRNFIIWLEENLEALLALDIDILSYALFRSCSIKVGIVEKDEKETGIRAYLNFGHTIGHAIESATGYSIYTHGEAIALGMVYESKIAMNMGLVDVDYVKNLSAMLKKVGLPTQLSSPDWDSIIEKMAYDKKNVGGHIIFILPTGYGKVGIFKEVDMKRVRQVLAKI